MLDILSVVGIEHSLDAANTEFLYEKNQCQKQSRKPRWKIAHAKSHAGSDLNTLVAAPNIINYGLLVCWRSNPANYLEGEINPSWRADTLFWQDSRDPHVCVQDLAPIFHCGIICNVGPPNDRITLVDAQAS